MDHALVTAVRNNNLQEVRRLLEAGADVHADNDRAFRMAAFTRNINIEIMRLLLDHGADVHANNDVALLQACIYGNIDLVHLLVEYGMNISGMNDALFEAIENLEITRFLLENGANPNILYSDPDIMEDIQDNAELMELLREYGLMNPRDAARAQEAKNEEKRIIALEEVKNKKEEKNENNPMVEKLCMVKDTLGGDELKDDDDFVVFLLQNEGKDERGECYLKSELEKIVENAPNISLWEGPPSGTIYNGPQYLAGEKPVPYPGKRKEGIINKVYKLPWTGIWVTNGVIQRAVLSGDLIVVLQGENASIGSSHGVGNLHGQYGGHWGYLDGNVEEAVYFEDGDFEPDERMIVYDVADSYR